MHNYAHRSVSKKTQLHIKTRGTQIFNVSKRLCLYFKALNKKEIDINKIRQISFVIVVVVHVIVVVAVHVVVVIVVVVFFFFFFFFFLLLFLLLLLLLLWEIWSFMWLVKIGLLLILICILKRTTNSLNGWRLCSERASLKHASYTVVAPNMDAICTALIAWMMLSELSVSKTTKTTVLFMYYFLFLNLKFSSLLLNLFVWGREEKLIV